MTKQAKRWLESYERSTAYRLSDVYTTWSYAKENAYDWCMRKCNNMDGYGFRILSANTFQFTCGWLTENENSEITLHIETASNTYNFKLR